MPFFSVFPAAGCSHNLKIMSVVSVTVIHLLPAQPLYMGAVTGSRALGHPLPQECPTLRLQAKAKPAFCLRHPEAA